MKSQRKMLGVAKPPQVPGAPPFDPNIHLRGLITALEGQRNIALSAAAEAIANYQELSTRYEDSQRSYAIEVAAERDKVRRLELRIAELEGKGTKPV